MKQFACGDLVPGCDATWVCSTEDDILSNVAAHASTAHGLVEISPELVAAIRANIVTTS